MAIASVRSDRSSFTILLIGNKGEANQDLALLLHQIDRFHK